MNLPSAADLETLDDGSLLDLLDAISNEVKRRNTLRPKTAGRAAVEIMQTLSGIASAKG